jgi:hypothetical protein
MKKNGRLKERDGESKEVGEGRFYGLTYHI